MCATAHHFEQSLIEEVLCTQLQHMQDPTLMPTQNTYLLDSKRPTREQQHVLEQPFHVDNFVAVSQAVRLSDGNKLSAMDVATFGTGAVGELWFFYNFTW